MKSKMALAALPTIAFLLIGSGARADVVTFALENLVFDDGTSATGMFTYNATTHIATPDITSVTGTIIGATYTTPITAALAADTQFVFISAGNKLLLEAPNPLSETSASSIFGDESGPLALCPGTQCPGFRDVNLSDKPTIDPTPLPAAFPLFATGLGALGLLGWRRKRKAQATTP